MTQAVPLAHTLFSLFFGAAILAVVVELIRRNRLQERYAALWIVLAVAFMTYRWWLAPAAMLARWGNVGDVVTVVLFLGIFMCALLILQLAVKVSEFSTQIKNLTQEVALLKHELAQREEGSPGRGDGQRV